MIIAPHDPGFAFASRRACVALALNFSRPVGEANLAMAETQLVGSSMESIPVDSPRGAKPDSQVDNWIDWRSVVGREFRTGQGSSGVEAILGNAALSPSGTSSGRPREIYHMAGE
ncbi:hypothetical protein DTO027B5_2979 [Paecilomyces variotii]|nr:hypothetical protein DTO027B3_6112 [Paecilomyces variotii]KAJ9335283.1 hypothetical protein DTO027B5_2979 [Paecilomyces variotii]